MSPELRALRLFLALLLSLVASGCAYFAEIDTAVADQSGPYENRPEDPTVVPTVVGYDEYKDPLEFINRPIFVFNDWLYRYGLSPVSRGYRWLLPATARKHISLVFSNLREPLDGINHLLQGEPKTAGKNFLRFGINSTVGVLGVFDPADRWWELRPDDATYGDTLARYGLGYGAYLVLPVLGPSDLRSGSSLVLDYVTHPVYWFTERSTGGYIRTYGSFHDMTAILEKYPDLVLDTDDDYLFIRNLYLQRVQRDADVLQGAWPSLENAEQ